MVQLNNTININSLHTVAIWDGTLCGLIDKYNIGGICHIDLQGGGVTTLKFEED
jgi:hypothetical protein